MPLRRLSPPLWSRSAWASGLVARKIGRRQRVDPLLGEEADPFRGLAIAVDQLGHAPQIVAVEQVPGRLPRELRVLLPGFGAETPVLELRRGPGHHPLPQVRRLAGVSRPAGSRVSPGRRSSCDRRCCSRSGEIERRQAVAKARHAGRDGTRQCAGHRVGHRRGQRRHRGIGRGLDHRLHGLGHLFLQALGDALVWERRHRGGHRGLHGLGQ